MLKNLLILVSALGSLQAHEEQHNPSTNQEVPPNNQLITLKQKDGKTCKLEISNESVYSVTKEIFENEAAEKPQFMENLTFLGVVEYNDEIPIEKSKRIMPVDTNNGQFHSSHIDNLALGTGADVNQILTYYYGKDSYSSVTIEFRMLMANKDYMHMGTDLKEAVTTIEIKVLGFPYIYSQSKLGFIYGISSSDMIRTTKDDNRVFFGNFDNDIKHDLGNTVGKTGQVILKASDFKMDSSIEKLFQNYQTTAPQRDIMLIGYAHDQEPSVNVQIQLACDENPLPAIAPPATTTTTTTPPTPKTAEEVEHHIQAKEEKDSNGAAKNTLFTAALLLGVSACFFGITA